MDIGGPQISEKQFPHEQQPHEPYPRVIRCLYFSPTGGTKKVLEGVLRGLDGPGCRIIREDLTLPGGRVEWAEKQTRGMPRADLVILAGPVYEERMAAPFRKALENSSFRGEGAPALLLSVYGQVGFGLSLKDMNEVARWMGLRPLGGAVFIGEHSFSREDAPLAAGRPDLDDLAQAEAWGRYWRDHLKGPGAEGFPGRLPLQAHLLSPGGAALFTQAPQTEGKGCLDCGNCARVCPVGAVDEKTYRTDPTRCLRCYACSRICPVHIRPIKYRLPLLVRPFLWIHGRRRKTPQFWPEPGQEK